MRLGRVYGIVLLVVGAGFTWVATTMLRDAQFTLKLFTAGPGLAAVGLSMLFFPGGSITARESRNKEKDPKTFFTEAPPLHKIVWIVALLLGAVVGHAVV